MFKSARKVPDNVLDQALHKCKKAFIVTFFFAFAVNILSLGLPIYSLQVLDRVVSSGSLETLLMLTIVILGIFAFLSLLQLARSLTLIRVGEWLDINLAPVFLSQSISSASIRGSVGGSQNLRDLTSLKTFLTSAGINTLFDAPWSVLYIIVIFAIHPDLGTLALWSCILLFLLALLNAKATDSILNTANEQGVKSLQQVEIATRNAECIEAMGMTKAVVQNWEKINNKAMELQLFASKRNSVISGFSKFLRLALQITVTGLGAYLVLKNQLTVGGMIASSTLIGKALGPFDGAIEIWKTITSTHKAYNRLQISVINTPKRNVSMALPTPEGKLSVENIFYAPPPTPGSPQTTSKYILKGVTFSLEPGEILAVIGPSAAGKSSLAKLIAGVWNPLSGVVRLDAADVYTWNREDFGQHVGYLPQDVELFGGTIRDNIARLREDASPEDIVKAAKIAGVHEMILRLPDGYETEIGNNGSGLSAGQRQRIGLARAFFGNPRLIVLDEPNSNLDDAGDKALMQALHYAKNQKITTVIISHRLAVLPSVDKILLLQDGNLAAFGPRDAVLQKLAPQAAAAAPATNAISNTPMANRTLTQN